MKMLRALLQSLERHGPVASLRTYLVVAILLATLPISFLLTYRVFTDVTSARERDAALLSRSTTNLAQVVERELLSSFDALAALALSEPLQRERIGDFERLLRDRPQTRRQWASVFLTDAQGRLLIDTAVSAGSVLPANSNTRALAQKVGAQEGPAASGLASREALDVHAVLLGAPVRVGGSIRYVIGARVEAAEWQRILESAAPPLAGFSSLFDQEHRLIARTGSPQRLIGQPLPATVVQTMTGRSTGVQHTVSIEGGAILGAWQMLPGLGWGVGIGVPSEPMREEELSIVMSALMTTGVCLLLGVTLALLLAWRVTQPLRVLARSGPAPLPERLLVREIGLLREAMMQALHKDEAARRQLQAKADDFETLFDSSPIGLAFAQDAACRVVMRNPAMDQLFGGRDSYRAGKVEVMYQGRPLELARQPLQRAAMLGEAVPAMELEVRIPGRPTAYVIAGAVPLRDAQGKPRGAISAMMDITERKQVEARLLAADRGEREKQRLIDLAEEAGQVGFFAYRFRVDEMNWTQGQAKLFGAEPSPRMKRLREWLALMDEADRPAVRAKLAHAMVHRLERETLEFRTAKDPAAGPLAEPRWLSSRVLLRYADDGRPEQMIGITVDASEHKEMERRRARETEKEQAARLQAEAANRAKDEFLTMLSHELRNPLGAITAAVEVLKANAGGPDKARKAQNIISRQSAHLAHMMNDLLDVSRVIGGKILLSRRPLNLAELVERVRATLDITQEARAHTLRLALQDAWVEADPTRIEQVLTNLLTNAFKYTPEGGTVTVQVEESGGEAVLRVADTGAGIPETLLPHIFDLFVQGGRTLERREGGLGVGLTLVRRLVELHGGTITVQSDTGGSTFTVRLPAIEKKTVPATSGQPRTARAKPLQVALIEDNEDAKLALRTLLEIDGHQVVAESDGASGLALLLREWPDVALVDIGLPGLDGYEVARGARRGGFAGRMVAMSGYGQRSRIDDARKAGFDAYLVKPIDAEVLRASLCEKAGKADNGSNTQKRDVWDLP